MAIEHQDAILGCLLGTAVGDAMGLPCEGLSRRRQRRLFPRLNGPNLLFGRGMVSDDTDHTRLVAESLAASGGDPAAFAADLARRTRGWFLALPPGLGLATLKACLRLLAGYGPDRSGIPSAGNGPAMRSAILGVAVPTDRAALCSLVRLSTRLTHTDPRAEWGALAVAIAGAKSVSPAPVAPGDYLRALDEVLPTEAGEFRRLMDLAAASAERGEGADAFAAGLGLTDGIGGYVYHTVPVVIQVWLRRPDEYAAGVEEIIRCGGDADTTAAILGGLIGARVGIEGIPAGWRARVWHWPFSEAYFADLAAGLARLPGDGRPRLPERPYPLVALRNAVQLAAVLAHGFRRLLPPYG